MRTLLFFLGSTLGSIAFQLTVALKPQSFQSYGWAVKYVWIMWALIWLIWLATHANVRAFGRHLLAFNVPKKEAPAAQIEADNVLLDPCIYVTDFLDESNLFVPASPILLENRGGDVAHAVKILPVTIGYTEVTFDCIDTIGIGEKKKAIPRFRVTSTNAPFGDVHEERNTIFYLLKQDLDAKNKAQGTMQESTDLPLTIIYKPRDQRHHFETQVELVYFPGRLEIERKLRAEGRSNDDWPHDAYPWREIRHKGFAKT